MNDERPAANRAPSAAAGVPASRASRGRTLQALFEPASIAMIGPSKRSALAAGMARRLKLDEFRGPVWMVTPAHEEIFGYRCFPSLGDLPAAPELVILGVNANRAPAVLEEAADAGAKAAIVISTGFSDAGEEGRALAARLASIAQDRGIALCGPGSFGYSVPATGVSPFGEGPRERMPSGHVAVVAQSGGFANILSHAAVERGFGFSYLVASGSESALTASDYVDYIVDDDATRVIVTILEEIRDVPLFTSAVSRAAARGKPVITLMLGRSSLGQRVTSAHSGALSSRADIQEAYLRRAGAIVVTNLDDLVETLVLMNAWHGRIPSVARPLMVSISGGDCGLCADLASDQGLDVPALSESTRARLETLLPDSTLLINPIDLGTRPLLEPKLGIEVMQAAAGDDNVNLVLYRLSGDPKDFPNLASACAALQKPFAVFTRMSLALDPAVVAAASAADIPLLQGIDRAMGAVKRAAEWERRRQAASDNPCSSRDGHALSDATRAALSSSRLSEREALAILREAGVPTVQSRPVTIAEEAASAARDIGFPVVVKIDSPDIEHKSDIGGVRLGLVDEKAVIDAFDEVMANARRNRPDAKLQGAIVQPMLSPVVELILGSVSDRRFGTVVVVGLGGVLAEILRRREIVVPPISYEEALATITRLLAADATGNIDWRGLQVEAAARALERFAGLVAASEPYIEAIDINPLGVFRNLPGAIAMDCLIKTTKGNGSP